MPLGAGGRGRSVRAAGQAQPVLQPSRRRSRSLLRSTSRAGRAIAPTARLRATRDSGATSSPGSHAARRASPAPTGGSCARDDRFAGAGLEQGRDGAVGGQEHPIETIELERSRPCHRSGANRRQCIRAARAKPSSIHRPHIPSRDHQQTGSYSLDNTNRFAISRTWRGARRRSDRARASRPS